MLRVWTIGHSNVDRLQFESLLEAASINVIADVRPSPSSWLPRFNRATLNSRLNAMETALITLKPGRIAGIMKATRGPQLQRGREAAPCMKF